MRALIKKRQNIFIKMIHEQAALTLEDLEALQTYFENNDPAVAKFLTTKEKESDEARRILIGELKRTFVTPFDREDIFTLSRAKDDVLDYAYSTVSEMVILDVKATPFMQRMASLLRDVDYELLMAVNCLEDHVEMAGEHAQRAKDIEQMLIILKIREVYRHLSNAAATNVIGDIVVKIA